MEGRFVEGSFVGRTFCRKDVLKARTFCGRTFCRSTVIWALVVEKRFLQNPTWCPFKIKK